MQSKRRSFLFASGAAAAGCWLSPTVRAAGLTSRERVARALDGREVDRPPISLWNHFGLEKEPPERHAEATLAFHRSYGTDVVKVMSDFPYPRPQGAWYELQDIANPFPAQIRALELVRQGLDGRAFFVETIFNPWNVAEKLSSPAEVKRLQAEKPQQLLDALTVIAKAEASHARQAVAAGADGIFLAVANAQEGILTPDEYARFSEPFDRIVLEAVREAPLNILHLHGDKVYLERFYEGWPARAINYSRHATGVSLAAVRARYPGVLMGGIDETRYRSLDSPTLRAQYESARTEAGPRYILTPGCSVPNDATPDELKRLRALFEA
jgi:uroporphyrinogen decarboxylase